MSGPRPSRAFSTPPKISAQQLQNELQAAVSSATGQGQVNPYKKVAAVLIHFEEDDIGVAGLEIELAETFKKYYGIHNVQHITIPRSGDPHWVINQALFRLNQAGFTEKNCLIILVFSGHGQSIQGPATGVRADSWSLRICGAMANGSPSTKTCSWNAVAGNLDYYECDVVHILDCCYAAEACNGAVEVLGACARSEQATASLTTSFTQALVTELRRLSSGPVTIGLLFSEIMVNRRAHGLDSTPFYYKNPNKNSVLLPTKGKQGMMKAPQIGPNDARILVTAHVDESLARGNVDQLKQWLTTMLPASVLGMEVALEGIWKANSSIILLSLPACVWSQLNEINAAFTYIGEVSSRNHLLEWNAQGPTLALRPNPPKGVENKKPGQSSTEK